MCPMQLHPDWHTDPTSYIGPSPMDNVPPSIPYSLPHTNRSPLTQAPITKYADLTDRYPDPFPVLALTNCNGKAPLQHRSQLIQSSIPDSLEFRWAPILFSSPPKTGSVLILPVSVSPPMIPFLQMPALPILFVETWIRWPATRLLILVSGR